MPNSTQHHEPEWSVRTPLNSTEPATRPAEPYPFKSNHRAVAVVTAAVYFDGDAKLGGKIKDPCRKTQEPLRDPSALVHGGQPPRFGSTAGAVQLRSAGHSGETHLLNHARHVNAAIVTAEYLVGQE